MKNALATLFLSVLSFYSFAQEKTIEIKINGEASNTEGFWKIAFLIIFIIAILWFVARTFRGKSDA